MIAHHQSQSPSSQTRHTSCLEEHIKKRKHTETARCSATSLFILYRNTVFLLLVKRRCQPTPSTEPSSAENLRKSVLLLLSHKLRVISTRTKPSTEHDSVLPTTHVPRNIRRNRKGVKVRPDIQDTARIRRRRRRNRWKRRRRRRSCSKSHGGRGMTSAKEACQSSSLPPPT